MEKIIMKNGKIRSDNFDTYIIASSMDVPKMDVNLYECDDKAGSYGAKSLGESATEGVAAAIVSAVKNATGLHIRAIPFNKVDMLEKLVDAKKSAAV